MNKQGNEHKLSSGNEMVRYNWRSEWGTKNLLNPLFRIMQSTKMEWLLNSLSLKLDEYKHKTNFKLDYSEQEQKIDVMVEISEYHFALWELAYQSNLAAFRTERTLQQMIWENEKLKQEIKQLNQEKEF